MSFERWREEHPGGVVLSHDTGHNRPYGTNPHDFYDSAERPFLFRGEVDDRMEAMARVVRVEVDREAAAYPYSRFTSGGAEAAVAHDRVGGTDVVMFWKAGVASALDSPQIAEGRTSVPRRSSFRGGRAPAQLRGTGRRDRGPGDGVQVGRF